jgi:hypothetical protein
METAQQLCTWDSKLNSNNYGWLVNSAKDTHMSGEGFPLGTWSPPRITEKHSPQSGKQ